MFVVSVYTFIDPAVIEHHIPANDYANACVVASRYSNINLEGVEEHSVYITNEETNEHRCFYEVNNR